jgi:peptidoglycan/xylan/chitin deacetylase (PgdA/CDA1 family)
MQDLGIPSIVFVPSESIGKEPIWTDDPVLRSDGIMDVRDLADLPEGSAEVGSHGMLHRGFPGMEDESAWKELCESKQLLEAITGGNVRYFSFPHGEYEPFHIQQAERCGYLNVFTIFYGWNRSRSPGFVLDRVKTDPWDWNIEFFLKIHGAYSWQRIYTGLKLFARRRLGTIPNGRNQRR